MKLSLFTVQMYSLLEKLRKQYGQVPFYLMLCSSDFSVRCMYLTVFRGKNIRFSIKKTSFEKKSMLLLLNINKETTVHVHT